MKCTRIIAVVLAAVVGCGYSTDEPGIAETLAVADLRGNAAPADSDSAARAETDEQVGNSTVADSGSVPAVDSREHEDEHASAPPSAWTSPAPIPVPDDLLDDLISLSIDALLLDLIVPAPTGPTGPGGGFTHLELLCRDQGIPDHVCRQRYGR